MQFSTPALGAQSPWDSEMGDMEESISQCTFLQMTYTAENPHADGSVTPGARPRLRPPCHLDPPACHTATQNLIFFNSMVRVALWLASTGSTTGIKPCRN